MSSNQPEGFLPEWIKKRQIQPKPHHSHVRIESKIKKYEPACLDAIEQIHFEILAALRKEIEEVRQNGSSKIHIMNGAYLGDQNGNSIYTFTTDREVRFPDDIKTQIRAKNRLINAYLISSERFIVIIALKEYLGDKISSAIMQIDPWYLLEKLKDGLSKDKDKLYRSELTRRLLNLSVESSNTVRDTQNVAIEYQNANVSQKRAIDQSIQSKLTFVWGPPGTGKSTTLGLVASNLMDRGESVLILAHSNVAVDIAMLSLIACTNDLSTGRVVRLGVPYIPQIQANEQVSIRGIVKRTNPQLVNSMETNEKRKRELLTRLSTENTTPLERHYISKELKDIKRSLNHEKEELDKKELKLISKIQVVGCTLSKLTLDQHLQNRQFDNVLIDEASMAYIPHCVFASLLTRKRLIIFGDFRQLPPIAHSENSLVKKWLIRDIYQHNGLSENLEDPRMTLLDEQYRMHPSIAEIPNKLFYDSKLKTASEILPSTEHIIQTQPFSGYSLVTINTSSLFANCISDTESHSRFNLITALKAIELFIVAKEQGLDVGIATPYNAQSRLINRILHELNYQDDNVICSTVHRFQGSERSTIIFDTVENENRKLSRLFTDTSDMANRLANVVITRSKGKFIVLGDTQYLQSQLGNRNGLSKLIDMVRKQGIIEKPSWFSKRKRLFATKSLSIIQYRYGIEARSDFENDMKHANEEIAISWPSISRKSYILDHDMLQLQRRDVRFYISGNGIDQFLIGLKNTQLWQSRSKTPYGLVGIDSKILWLFLNPEDKDCVVIRIDMPQTTRLLYRLFGLIPKDDVKLEVLNQLKDSAVNLPCEKCGQSLYPYATRNGVILACANSSCGYTKKVNPQAATELARLKGINCEECGGLVKGQYSKHGVFLGCDNYPRCNWTKPLEILI